MRYYFAARIVNVLLSNSTSNHHHVTPSCWIGYPLHVVDLLAKLYRKQLTKVKVAGTLSEWFHVKKGVDKVVLCPFAYLFNILAEIVMWEILDGFHGGLQIGGQIVSNLCTSLMVLNSSLLLAETAVQKCCDVISPRNVER